MTDQQTLRDRIADRLLAKDAESWGYGTFECSREFVLALADEMLAVRDDELAALRAELERMRLIARVNDGLHRAAHAEAEQAEAAVARVRAALAAPKLCGPSAVPSVPVTAVLAALDVPADGERGGEEASRG
ncbi:hypothetical protein Sme01_03650 [Sphaerisporangium melleum]|uniref:Uncharacterized protein n=1 Tax=Sphaerisporangium melleum TaxID=321316 RepID=A0A917QP40_9ACTN|nr:hypothetical protein [Sphaerisporangium melleum]GGK61781.1 hypothetical protein GCM10007964_01200 [Sphaerisporangium melleum]GII67889.1 hypothetical protein Sme01_03650 [Sphaerisporangium melleum]